MSDPVIVPPTGEVQTIPAYLSEDCQNVSVQCSRCTATYVAPASAVLSKTGYLRMDNCQRSGCPYRAMPYRLLPGV